MKYRNAVDLSTLCTFIVFPLQSFLALKARVQGMDNFWIHLYSGRSLTPPVPHRKEILRDTFLRITTESSWRRHVTLLMTKSHIDVGPCLACLTIRCSWIMHLPIIFISASVNTPLPNNPFFKNLQFDLSSISFLFYYCHRQIQ